jgi:hypothetical protein
MITATRGSKYVKSCLSYAPKIFKTMEAIALFTSIVSLLLVTARENNKGWGIA